MTLKSREEINIVTKKKKIGLGKILIPFFYENETNQPFDVLALGWIEMFCFFLNRVSRVMSQSLGEKPLVKIAMYTRTHFRTIRGMTIDYTIR